MKKQILAFLLCCVMVFSLFPSTAVAADATSGTWGTSGTWEFDTDTKTLTLSGNEAMPDYGCTFDGGPYPPWKHLKDVIVSVILNEGITSIGNSAFGCDMQAEYYSNLSSITLPSTLKRIGRRSLTGSQITALHLPRDLQEVKCIPSSVTELTLDANNQHLVLEDGFLYDKDKTEILHYPTSAQTQVSHYKIPATIQGEIYLQDFCNISSLKSITIPENVDFIGNLFTGYDGLREDYDQEIILYFDGEVPDVSNWEFWRDGTLITIVAQETPSPIEPATFSVTFSSLGGSSVDSVTGISYGATISAPEAPTRSGYTFGGWYKDQDCSAGQKWSFSEDVVTENTVLYAKWTVRSSSGSSSSSAPVYLIDLDQPENGKLWVVRPHAEAGTTVSLTATPHEGYELVTLSVTDQNGAALDVLAGSDNAYTFTMPAGKVVVTASFQPISSTPSTPDTEPAPEPEPEPEPDIQSPFDDISPDDYFYASVLWAVENGITAGTSVTTFSPDLSCTRAQTMMFLWRAMGSAEPSRSVCSFVDVAPGTYYRTAVLWASETGITAGTSETTFGSNDTCTRAQIIMFLWRAMGSPEVQTTTCSFSDVSVDAYYYPALLWAVENGITSGTSAVTFSPNDTCTRAQTMTLLHNVLK